MIPFNWRHLFYQARNSVFNTRGSHRQLTGHRVTVLVIFWILFIPHQIVTRICLALDNVFFPGWRNVKIEKPCFITGLFRSGTTYLHRLLAKDSSVFATFLTWEIYVAPSILQRKFFHGWKKLDRLLGSPAMRLLKLYDTKKLNAVKFHKVGLWKGEEDEGIFLYLWDSLFTWFFFPGSKNIDYLADEEIHSRRQNRRFGFYAACIRRHLYCHPDSPVYLSKNPAFTAQLAPLKEYFPDARIIYLIRDPQQVLISQTVWFSFCWHYFCTPTDPYPFRRELLEMTENWYRYSIKLFKKWKPSDVCLIRYGDLIANPLPVIKSIYAYCGLELSSEFLEYLVKDIHSGREYSSAGKLSLTDIGYDEEEVRQHFAGITVSAFMS